MAGGGAPESETRRYRSLRDVLTNLKAIDAPKTLMFVSQGFFTDASATTSAAISEIGALASAARDQHLLAPAGENPTDVTRAEGR